MRYLKTMGLAAMAVFALVAFAGATSASADILCSTNTNPCTGTTYRTGDVVRARLSGSAVLTTAGGVINPRITCTGSNVNITLTNGGGAGIPVGGKLASNSDLTFTSCTSTGPAGCSSSGTVTGAPTLGSLTATSGGNGTLVLAPPSVSFNCPVGSTSVTCTFGGSGSVTGTFTGGNPATVTFTNQSIASTGNPACPTSARWTATYVTTSAYYAERT